MIGLARILGMSAIALGLAACGGDAQPDAGGDKVTDGSGGIDIRGIVGVTKTPPDEFAVAPTKPLQLPKDFASLPPPTPGTRSPLQPDPIAEARAVLLGETEPVAANARVSASESALLASTGTGDVDPNIRNVLDAEEAERAADRPDFLLNRIFPSSAQAYSAEDTLAPEEERVRLSEILPQRTVGGTEIATIPTGSATTPAAAPTTITPPVSPSAIAPALTGPPVAIDPVTGSELIFIPE